MIDSIICKVRSWLLIKEFGDFSLNEFLKDRITCILIFVRPVLNKPNEWVPPMVGKVKVNFDEVSFSNPRPTRYGCILRHSNGCIILAKGEPIGISDALHVEMMGFLEGLCILKQKDLIESSVEGNSNTVISWGEGKKESSWKLHHLICEARA